MSKPLIPPSTTTHTTSPHNNDVLCGRGGTINAHPGNEQYRKFVERKKRVYLTARFKREKRLIASSIVEEIRNLDPPGRFLMKDPHSEIWYDVGDEKARDKTSQALRENALSVRKQMEEEFQETRRQQAREVAIAAGRDPDEAVKNMMSAVTSLGKQEKKKDGKKGHVIIPPGQPGQPQPGRRHSAGAGGFVGRSGYGPLYDAQQPAPPQASAPHPPPGQWGYHGGGPPPPHQHHAPPHGGAPMPASYNQPPGPHPPQPGQHGSSPSAHYPPPAHAQRSYFQPPPPHGMQQQHPPPHQQQPTQPPYYGSHPSQQQPPPPQHQHSYPQYSGWPNPAHSAQPPPHQLPPHQPPTAHQQPQHQQQHQPQQHHTISQPMLAPRRSGQSPPKNGGMLPPPPHPLIPRIPSDLGHPDPTPIIAGAPPPAIAPSPLRNSAAQPQQPPSDRHVQFQKEALVAPVPAPPPDPRRNIEDIPLIISSKKRLQPRSRHTPHGPPGTHSPDKGRRGSSSMSHPESPTPASPATHNLSLSPKSQAVMSEAMGMGHHPGHSPHGTERTHGTEATGATPLTFLSTDMSVKTSDSLSNYLKGIEDEISGDVGQEVELIAHAPMLDQQKLHHHNYRGGGSMYSRSTPPRHHLSVGSSSQKSSGSSRHSRRRKRRSGNHIPSNSGKVQVDWSSAAAPTATAPSPGGPAGANGAPIPQKVAGGKATAVVGPTPVGSSSDVNATLPCGGSSNAASTSCGVILPTPLRSSNNGTRSPASSAMAPPPSGIPPLPTTPGASHMTPISPGAPMSPVHSLDLERMSLCGTENVSQTGGSIGGASLCNVFDDHEDSVVGASALMDMTMSIGSHPSSGPGGTDSSGDAQTRGRGSSPPIMGLHPVPLGLSPQAVFGDERSAGGSALMDMSVGSGANSKENSGGSSRGSSGRSRGSGGGRSGSPASIDKGTLKMEQEHQQFAEESREQPPPPTAVPMYAHDFKFTWDGKREE